MEQLTRRMTIGFAALAAAGLLVAACGGDGSGAPGAGLSGDIEIDGSSTVFPISQAVGEEFHKENPRVQVPIGISGTGGGLPAAASWAGVSA